MNTKTLFTLIMTFLMLSACSTDNGSLMQDEEFMKTNFLTSSHFSARTMNDFDYSFYNQYKDVIITNLNTIRSNKPEPTVEGIQSTIDFINVQTDSNIEMIQYDYDLLDSNHENWQDFYSNYLSTTDMNLIQQFSSDADSYGYEVALNNFKSNILRLNPNETEFARYNQIVNTIMIANDFFEGLPTNVMGKRPSWWGAAGCAVAIAANAGSTYSLIACAAVPPAGCALAATMKVLAVAGVIFGCG